jgi:GT2 family glycosyltransferase
MATKIAEHDLAGDPRDLTGLEPYSQALVLLRWKGRVLGQVRLLVDRGAVSASSLLRAAHVNFGHAVTSRIVEDLLSGALPPREKGPADPSCSVVVCTRDRPEDLRRCLEAACPSADPRGEVIVVDNAPSDDRTARLAKEFPVRYVLEPRRGLNRARTRGAEEAGGEVVVYIDDDAIPGNGWLDALLEPFGNPEVAAVTGLVMPVEMETEAQERFERYCGFARGFRRAEFTAATISPLAAANVGAGACMAIRRRLVNELGLFRSEQDCGTATRSGGDTYAFYRLLSLGHRIVYNPDAVAWHRHRRTETELRETLAGYSVGTYAFLLRALLVHGEIGALHIAFRWFLLHHLRNLYRGFRGKADAPPVSLTLAEIGGILAAPGAYLKSRREESRNAGETPASPPGLRGGPS